MPSGDAGGREVDDPPRRAARERAADEVLDPMTRAMWSPAPARVEPSASPRCLPFDVDRVVERLVRRIAISKTEGRAVARLELGDLAFAARSVTIEATEATVALVVDGASDPAVDRWAQGVAERLRQRGFTVSVDVH